jgi:hypothetical protein
MKNNQKKFILSLQVNNRSGAINYYADSSAVKKTVSGDHHRLEFVVDVFKTNTIKLYINQRVGSDSHIQITDMLYNNIKIADLNSVSFLKTTQGEIRKNYGYIDAEGEFVIKLHTNPVSQHYLNYLLQLTKQS